MLGPFFSLLNPAPGLINPNPAPSSPEQGSFPLHWPLINSDHMRDRLGKAEMDKKRIADAKRLALQDPNHRCGECGG